MIIRRRRKMKLCTRFFEHAYINPRGDVRICSWNNVVIGNLLQNTMEEIWNSDARKKLLDELLKGERYQCREQHCPHCINDELVEMSNEEIIERWKNSKYPVEYNCAFDYRCNHVCPSCRNCLYVPDKQYVKNMQMIAERLGEVVPYAKHIFLSGSGELFTNPESLQMLKKLKPVNPDFTLGIETNGTLLKQNWNKVSHLQQYISEITVTANSFEKNTYKYLAGKDDLELLKENLQYIKELKKKLNFKFTITMVVQDTNFREIPDFINTCLNIYDVDSVVLRPVFMWFQISKFEWWYKNVQNPAHLYHNEYLQILKNPICSDPRVLHWGTRDEMDPITLEDIYKDICG